MEQNDSCIIISDDDEDDMDPEDKEIFQVKKTHRKKNGTRITKPVVRNDKKIALSQEIIKSTIDKDNIIDKIVLSEDTIVLLDEVKKNDEQNGNNVTSRRNKTTLSLSLRKNKVNKPEKKTVISQRLNNFLKKDKNPKSIKNQKVRRKHICPAYKIVSGTTFAVDAFNYGEIENVTHYFLSHFHADHYVGLRKSFAKPLYVSAITGRLVKEFIKVSSEYITVLQIKQAVIINNVEITALEANHCPGAIMFFFKLPNGRTILHTGDFRASPEMEEYHIFWNHSVDVIYLDTTYLSSRYAFQSQYESICRTKHECKKFILNSIGENFLIIFGAYTIGKEKLWLAIAQAFNFKIWVEPARRKALDCFNDELYVRLLVDNPQNARIHILPLMKIQYQFLAEYQKNFDDYFTKILAFRPSGWETNSKPRYGMKISIVGIEYSEHSSYDELDRFVKYLKPKEIISTVPNNHNTNSLTNGIPIKWLESNEHYHRSTNSSLIQPKLTSYLKKL